MMLFDKDGNIKRYETPQDILMEFFDMRIDFYEKRRHALLKVLKIYLPILFFSCFLDPQIMFYFPVSKIKSIYRKYLHPFCLPPSQLQAMMRFHEGWLSSCFVFYWQVAEAEQLKLRNRVRFILAVISGELKVGNRRKKDIEADLLNEGYDKIATGKAAKVHSPSCSADLPLPNKN